MVDDRWNRANQSMHVPSLRRVFGDRAAPYTSANAFLQLYERAHLPVYRFVYALHGGPTEDVEDIAAETWERAWNGRAQFRGTEHDAVGWLLTIARNLVIDKQRSEQRRPAWTTLAALPFDPPGDVQVDRDVLHNEQQQSVLAALHILPVAEREMIVLHYVLGWQIKRIAAHHRLRPNTASVKLRRALDRLRQQLNQEDMEP